MINWNPNPELVSFGFITIHWYGLFFVSAFLIGYKIILSIFHYEGKPTEELDDLFYYSLLGAVIGARLGHCLFYDPHFYLSNPIEILKIWKGGLASHGGGVGLLIVMSWFVKKSKIYKPLWLLDRVAIPTALAGSFIRIANFINSEIIGIPTNGSWGVIFQRVDSLPRHPAQLYEAVLYFSVFVLLVSIYFRYQERLKDGVITGLFLVSVFCGRAVIEFYKIQEASIDLDGITMGQILSIPYILAGCYILFRASNLMKRR